MRFVQAHRDTFGVEPICAAIKLPVSTYYARRNRAPSARELADEALAKRIEGIWRDSDQTYGAPRVHATLAREGIYVGRKRVERLMRDNGWVGAHLRRGWKTTTRQAKTAAATASPDLVQRQFRAERPNALWVADVTYVRTLQGFFTWR